MLIASSYPFQQSGDVDFEMQSNSRRVKITPKKERNGEMYYSFPIVITYGLID